MDYLNKILDEKGVEYKIELEKNAEILIYPNPSQGIINIKSSSEWSALSKAGKIPPKIPSQPSKIYKNQFGNIA